MEETVRLPLIEELLPGGLRFGANYLVEFEPQSIWYETSLTLCAQALRQGLRTDYHSFTHPSGDIRRQLKEMGLDIQKLEADETFRVIDSYSVQTGMGAAERVGKGTTIDYVELKSVKMADWDKNSVDVMRGEIPPVDRRRLHIDDNTSVLVQFNDEKSVAEHFRTPTVPYARRLELAAIHSVAAGIYADSFYKQFEAFCDGIIDFRGTEESGKVLQSMRVRVMRGRNHDSSWRRLKMLGNGEVSIGTSSHGYGSPMSTPDSGTVSSASGVVDIPFFAELIPGGIEYGSVLLVEFEPQSCWYEASYTLAAQALEKGLKTDLHIFQHNPKSVREAMKRFGLDIKKLEEADLVRFIDSYSVQVGVGQADVPKGADAFKTSSVKLEDWARAAAAQMSSEIPESERNRLHIDDNTAILSRYNKEDELIDYWRTKIIPLYRARDGVLINAIALGVASDSFYKQHESMVDGIIDCRSREEDGVVEHYIRVRAFRGKNPDTRWQRVKVFDGKVVLERGRLKEGSLDQLGPEGRGAEEERRLAAIMFTDMVGFTGMAQRNEALAMELLEEQRKMMRPFFIKHRGREVKTIGDAFLVEFSSALEAVKCAIGIQEALKRDNANRPLEKRLVVRIGVHLGDVIHAGSDVAGDAVNVASRIEPLSSPGGVCVSGQVYESVVNKVEVGFESMGTPHLKNVSTPVSVFKVIGLGDTSTSSPSAKSSLPTDRIAILPFTNISMDISDEYFADGMTEELISSVSRTQGLRVIARTSVMRYKGAKKTIAEIGRELNVGSVLEGSVRKAGDKVRVTVQLVDTANEEPRWSREYDRELRDIFAIQSDVAHKVAEALRVHVLGTSAGGGGRPTSNTDAYVDYLRGRQAWNRRNEEGLKQAIDFFEKALTADKNYAMAYTGLADSYATLALLELVEPNEAYPSAKMAVSRALSLNPQLAEAHTSLGLIRFQYDWDWEGAEDEFREAIKLNPGYAPAHHYFADYLKAMGRFDEALSEISKAQELDPLNLAINAGVGHVLYLSRQYDKAIDQYRKTVDLDPSFMLTHVWFGRPYLEKGMFAEAISELETGVRLSGEGTLALGMLGHGLASAGRKEEAMQVLEKLKQRSKSRYVPSYWVAVVYNGFKDREQVLAWLRKAFDERSSWLVWSNVEPRFDWLRDDPEFASLMRAMRFP
ncbi:MAG TPA: adenylate/guanylate cyclase domain-containing protein [Nitrososphaerales archaeon]|nr:adenylate/guanylate cyclase domain-containing protein [Nitrososphaerales archaeon]